MKKPIAIRISDWDSQTEIIYSCYNCGTSFAILSHNEKYCHNCGSKQDWDVVTHLINPLNNGDYFSAKAVVNYINEENKKR